MLPPALTSDRTALESLSFQSTQTLYLGNKTALCRVLGKYIMFVDTDDIGIAPHLCFNGYWEAWITMALARTIKPGWRCIDIGANHGYYSLIMADAVGPEGSVLAIEPHPWLAELLKRNIDVNGFPHTTTILQLAIVQAAVGKLSLVIPDSYRSLNGSVCRAATAADKVFEVDTISLDEAVKDWPRVDFIKIDAEGAEEIIWEGMQQTIAANPDLIILMEVNALRYRDPHKLVRQIQEAGFPLRFVDYDARIHEISEHEIVTNPTGADSMLFLQRS
jgi:FkbM family methyltransferase